MNTQHLEEWEEDFVLKVINNHFEKYEPERPGTQWRIDEKKIAEYIRQQRKEQHNKTVMECLDVLPSRDQEHEKGCYYLQDGSYLKRHCDCGAFIKDSVCVEVEQAIKSLLK